MPKWKVTKKCIGYIEADTPEEAIEDEELEFNEIVYINPELIDE